MTDRRTLVLATRNDGKTREMQNLFSNVLLDIVSLSSLQIAADIDETGSTFAENAELKAAGYARLSGELCLADDSGLEVSALDGAPGIYSARFGGIANDYSGKISKLLSMIDESGSGDRSARFVCCMALADPEGSILHTVEGIVEGAIANAPRGAGGFGYDPVFIPSGYDRTFGELGDEVKQTISHRAKAADAIIRFLLDSTGSST